MSARICALLTAAVVATPHLAHASGREAPAEKPDDSQLARAMEVYKRGSEHFKNEEYEAALADFQEASTLYASPDFQYNIGRCYEELGRYSDAIRAFEIYLRAKPNAPDSGDVRERIGRLRGLAEAQAQQEQTADEEDKGGQDDPSATPPPVVQPVQPADEPPPPGRPLVVSGSVLLGVGAALALGGGIGFGVVAGNKSDEIDEIQGGGNPQNRTLAEAQEIEDEGKNAEIAQIATAAAGGAIAVTGVVLLVLGLQKNKASRTDTARVTLVPRWSRRGGGLALTGRF